MYHRILRSSDRGFEVPNWRPGNKMRSSSQNYQTSWQKFNPSSEDSFGWQHGDCESVETLEAEKEVCLCIPIRNWEKKVSEYQRQYFDKRKVRPGIRPMLNLGLLTDQCCPTDLVYTVPSIVETHYLLPVAKALILVEKILPPDSVPCLTCLFHLGLR